MIGRPRNIVFLVLVLALIALGTARLFSKEDTWICEQGEWVKHGNPKDPAPTSGCGVSAEPTGNQNTSTPPTATSSQAVMVTTPKENEAISSPLKITGQARGTWFFEASFPVMLTDWDGKIIAQGVAQAQGDWMTENYVSFEATLTFTKPDYKDNGFLILKKDNPTGLPQNDAAVEIPIRYK